MAEQSSSSKASPSPSSLSNLVRLAPLQVGDLPSHPDLPESSADLLPFLTTLLDDGAALLSRSNFTDTFKHHSSKASAPSASRVEVLTHTVPASSIAQVPWSGAVVSRGTPSRVEAEHWFARRSVHQDVSSKSDETPGHASWDEFVYGLRDEHSRHEMDFTPTLYDARPVVDWNGQIRKVEAERTGRGGLKGYTSVTMGVYEMCHAIPPPLMPRCFCVLVATASCGEDEFVAVTVPVDLGSDAQGPKKTAAPPLGFYSSGRNVKDGKDEQTKKRVCMGAYTAVEVVRRDRERREVEWIMATSSDAKGNLPMFVQKLSLPGAIAKDVGFFLKWIKTVDEEEIGKSRD